MTDQPHSDKAIAALLDCARTCIDHAAALIASNAVKAKTGARTILWDELNEAILDASTDIREAWDRYQGQRK